MRIHRSGHCRYLLASLAILTGTAIEGNALPLAYIVSDLGTLGGNTSEAFGINASGQVTGRASLSEGAAHHAFLWSPTSPNGASGTMADLGTLGRTSSAGNGVSASGLVTGYAQLAGDVETHAFLYDGTMHDLGTLGGPFSQGRGVNQSGEIVGEAVTGGGDLRAFFYDGVMNDLGMLGGSGSSGYGINDSGQVTGFAQTSSSGQAFLYDGSMHDLGAFFNGTDSAATDINDGGQITGAYFSVADLALHAFLWTPTVPNGATGTADDLGTLGGTSSRAWSINALGHVTGASDTTADAAQHAFLYTNDSGMVDLNSLIDPLSGWELYFGAGINDTGQITGTGYLGGEQHAFLLTPVPEPATVVLVACGLSTLVLRRPLRSRQGKTRRRTTRLAAPLVFFFTSCLSSALVRADIFQWEYVNPANPSLGKRQSTTLAPHGAGVNAERGAYLPGRNLTKAYLLGADLGPINDFDNYVRSDLRYVNLREAELSYASLSEADLANANLSQANLTNAYCAGAFLIGANLTDCDATSADLSRADLTGADARGALGLDLSHLGYAANLILPDGRVAGLSLNAANSLLVRDYDGKSAVPRIVVDQFMTMNGAGTLRMEFDADAWNSTISFAPGIPVVRDGALELTFAPGVDVAAQTGRTIDLFDWAGGAPTGAFAVSSPYAWNLSQLYTTGEITLLPSADFNGDGAISEADLASWKTGFGTTAGALQTQGDADADGDVDGADLLAWQRQLSSPASSGASNAPVPELATSLLLVAAVAILGPSRLLRRREHARRISARASWSPRR